MIPGLLSGRLLGGGIGGGVIAAPGYQQLLAYAAGTSSATADAQFVIWSDGTWSSSGEGYGNKSGLWYNPLTVGAGSAYEVRITLANTGGVAGIIDNQAAIWVPLSSPRALNLSVNRFTTGTTTSSYSVTVEIRLTGGAIVSTGTFQLSATAQVAAASPGPGPDCPALQMWLGAGLQAGEVVAGQMIDGVASDRPETLVRLQVLNDQASLQPCFRIVTSGGAACVLSESTPFTLRDGSTKCVPHMLGELVLRDDGAGGLVWDEVVQCYPVGELDVVKISVGGHSLLAGEHPAMRIVSHNQQKP